MGLYDFIHDHVNPTMRELNKMQKNLDREMKRVEKRNRSYYNDGDDYSNYSDMAERRRIRQEAKRTEISNMQYDINTYKNHSINQYLLSPDLINQSGVAVSVYAVKNDGDQKLLSEQIGDNARECSSLIAELKSIDILLEKIDKVLECENR